MSRIIIQNTTARMIGMGAAHAKAGKEVAHPELRFPPGATPIDSAIWEKIKENKTIAGMVKRGELEEGDTLDGDGEELPDKPVAAVKLVKGTLDMKRLRAWLEEDKRPAVRAAIEAQIALIDAKAAKPQPEGATGG